MQYLARRVCKIGPSYGKTVKNGIFNTFFEGAKMKNDVFRTYNLSANLLTTPYIHNPPSETCPHKESIVLRHFSNQFDLKKLLQGLAKALYRQSGET